MKKLLIGAALSIMLVCPAVAEEPRTAGAGQDAVEGVDVQAADELQALEPEAIEAGGGPVVAAETASWGYAGAGAAPYWAMLDEAYEKCGSGNMQSPINIARFLQEDLPDIVAAYKSSPLALVNSGHTIELKFQPGSGFSTDAVEYRLEKAQFHTPSEHYLDGAPYPMELQLMHRTDDGHYGVISVMVKLGEHNPVVEGIWQNAPIQAGGSKVIDTVEISAGDLLPQSLDYYRYEGSLTTPPCSEGVRWHILKEPIEISETQLKAFQALFPVNARPVQALNDRVITGD
ncbi:MAG: carbonic anhydrase family protein [Alphaproteobacteria bacterium]